MQIGPEPNTNISDTFIATGLIAAPAWGPWLSELNGILTTASLLVGLAIGIHRIREIIQKKKPPK